MTGNMVALMKVPFHTLIRKMLVSMATESWKIRSFPKIWLPWQIIVIERF